MSEWHLVALDVSNKYASTATTRISLSSGAHSARAATIAATTSPVRGRSRRTLIVIGVLFER